MDTANAVLLIAVAGGVITLVKAAFSVTNPKVIVAVTTLVSLATVFLARYSVWANEQVVGGKPLDELNLASLIIVGVFLAGAETAAWLGASRTVSAVANIGENQPVAK